MTMICPARRRVRCSLCQRLAGEILDLLPGFTSFPADVFTFWPAGRMVVRDAVAEGEPGS